MEIREQTTEDVQGLVGEAFGRPVVAELSARLRGGPHHLVALVALDPDPVGHVQLSRSWVDDPRRLVEVAVLSPLSVRADRRGEGIGTQLVAAVLAAARERGEAYVFLEGDPAYYGARGFGPAVPQGFSKPSVRIPDPAFQVSVLRDERLGGALVYNDVFWSLDCVGLR